MQSLQDPECCQARTQCITLEVTSGGVAEIRVSKVTVCSIFGRRLDAPILLGDWLVMVAVDVRTA